MRKIQNDIDSITLHKPWLIHIKNDLYGIAERIRHIDSGYFIVWNVVRKKYEVHNVDTLCPSTYEFTVPYNELDSRTLEYCKETRRENTEKLIAEIEKNNEKIDTEVASRRYNEIEAITTELATDLRRAI